MRFVTPPPRIYATFASFVLFLLIASCGSYQYVGYGNDGIYSSEDAMQERPVVDVDEAANSKSDTNYYSDYFSREAQSISGIAEEAEVFTDIDAYNSNGVANVDVEEILGNNAGWGDVNDRVVINVYDNGWNTWGWGWDPWLWNGGLGWGWNNWGWGWNRWGWNNWGWGGFGWGPSWGWNRWGWNNWGWNNRFYGNRLAFNYGRRGAVYGRRGNSLINSRSIARLDRNRALRRGVNSTVARRNRTGTLRTSNGSRLRRNANSTFSRSSSPGVRRGSTGTRSSRSYSRPSSRRSSGSGTIRRSSGSRSSSGRTIRSSGRSYRSSGSMRSGGGGGRSSGGSRGGGRSGGRRG